MAQQIQWRRGTFLKFFAQMKIRVGGKETLDIHKGDEFEFDGTICKYAGAEFAQINIRGAINQGWAILDGDSPEAIAPYVASRDIAKSQTKNSDLSRVQRTKAQPMETDSLDEETVLNVSDRRPGAAQNPRAMPQKITQENNRRASTAGQRVNSMQVEQSDVDTQEGTVVGRVRSAAKLKVEDITRESGLARTIENRVLGQPEMFKRNNTIEREGVTIRTNVGSVNREVQLGQEDDGVVVGKVRHTKATRSDGIEVLDTSNIRSRSSNPPKVETKVKTIQIDKSKLSQKHKVALSFDPEFPIDWNFVAPLTERMTRAKQFSKNQQFLRALYAAEGASMQKALQKQYPKLF